MIYGVKVIVTYKVSSRRYYEEIVLSLRAGSFDEAYDKAERYVRDYCDEYINVNGEEVRTEKFELLDCFRAFDEEDGVCEVYSRFIKNKSLLTETEYYQLITDQCGEKELYDLRRRDLNQDISDKRCDIEHQGGDVLEKQRN